jgi:glycosyltransferase involved in cell wall biosynthesis
MFSSLRSRRIAIITGASLAWNPRALKEASALAQCGATVTVIGSSGSVERLAIDTELANVRGFEFLSVGPLRAANWPLYGYESLKIALRRKANSLLFRTAGFETEGQICSILPEMHRKATSLAADYYIGHLEAGLCTCLRLQSQGAKIGFDMEDLISQDLTPMARKWRPIRLMRTLEKKIVEKANHVTCTSLAMSREIQAVYENASPTVVYNAFEWASRKSIDGRIKDRKSLDRPSIHWFSQTIGHSRGLEDLFASLPLIHHPCEIHLRGNPIQGFENWIRELVPREWQSQVFIHNLVGSDELLSRISEHDIGLAAEQPYCRNKDVTVSNKILYYLLAGLSVAASDTSGQREIAEKAGGSVALYPSGDHVALATILNGLLSCPDRLAKMKRAALHAAENTFCWEQSSKHLLSAVQLGITGAGENFKK